MYQFEDISNEKPYCADTWISIHNWTIIYEHLETFVDPDFSFDNKHSFDLRDTPLTCSISWSDIKDPLGQVMASFLSLCDNHKGKYTLPAFISIHVTKSIRSKFVAQLSTLKKEITFLKNELKKSKSSSSKTPSDRTRSESNRSHKHKTEPLKKTAGDDPKCESNRYTIDKLADDHEEYVPNAVGTDKTVYEAAVKYEPGRLLEANGANNAAVANVEKYVPPEVSPVLTSKPKYIPSSSSTSDASSKSTFGRKQIQSVNQTSSSQTRNDRQKNQIDTRSTRRNNGKKNTNKKRGHSPDLFGTDDEASETPPNTEDADMPPKSKHSNRQKDHHPTSNSTRSRSQSSKRNNPTPSNSKTNNNIVKSNSGVNPELMSSEQLKKFMDIKDEAISEMKKLSGLLRPEVLPEVEVVTLKHFSLSELEHRFEEHKFELKVLFDNYRKQKVWHF